MMKRKLVLLGLLISATMLWAGDTMLYGLQQVPSVSKKNLYVLVQNGRAICHVGNNNGLETREIDLTQAIDTTDDCVWRLRSAGAPGMFFLYYKDKGVAYYLRNSASSGTYTMANSSNLYIVGDASPTIWLFTFTENVAKIENAMMGQDDKIGNYLTLNNTEICKARTTGSSKITIYQLVPSDYKRTDIASDQIGTVCLPFATESYSGATFYTLLCKENDASGNPAKVYYEQVTDQLEAGKPYVYVPDKDATTLSFTAAEGTNVTTPTNYNGFVGTFTQIDPAATNALTDNYVISGNQFKKCGANCGLRAYRAYVIMKDVQNIDDVAAPARRMLVIGQNGEPEYMDPSPGTITAMQQTQSTLHSAQCTMQNGRIVIVRGQERYDLAGRRVE